MLTEPNDEDEEESTDPLDFIWLKKIEAMRCFATHRYTPQ